MIINKPTLLKLTLLFFMLNILCGLTAAYAKNIGTIGQIYSIKEVDFLEFIQSRVLFMQKNGLLNKLQNDMQMQAALYRDRPTAVINITHATQSKNWLFDPSIVLDHDLTTSDGKLIAPSGTRINPLTQVSLTKTLIFYNADNKKEKQWVSEIDKKLKGKIKIILVSGSVLKEESRLNKQIYFDQEGRLTKRFQITHVPAMVEQEGLYLRITEISL